MWSRWDKIILTKDFQNEWEVTESARSNEETEDIFVTHMQEAGEEEEVEEQQKDKNSFFGWHPSPDEDEDEDSFFGWPPSPDLIVPLVFVLVLLILTILLAWLLHRFAYPCWNQEETELANLV